jgi:hypothetical protein
MLLLKNCFPEKVWQNIHIHIPYSYPFLLDSTSCVGYVYVGEEVAFQPIHSRTHNIHSPFCSFRAYSSTQLMLSHMSRPTCLPLRLFSLSFLALVSQKSKRLSIRVVVILLSFLLSEPFKSSGSERWILRSLLKESCRSIDWHSKTLSFSSLENRTCQKHQVCVYAWSIFVVDLV